LVSPQLSEEVASPPLRTGRVKVVEFFSRGVLLGTANPFSEFFLRIRTQGGAPVCRRRIFPVFFFPA